ncbi:RNA-binding protein 8A-like [Halichondria panicea]|uniref:RNA-binding protein 8A-like n=1 Tax=Halichondria panicea TaxID=6063 RepID=UPI00312B53D3
MAGLDEVQLRPEDDEVEGLKKKGRGFDDKVQEQSGVFDRVEEIGVGPGPLKSVEGWIVFVKNIHEEAQEDDVNEVFGAYGSNHINLNLDRRTGFIEGYVLVEYETFKEASKAIENMNGAKMLGQQIQVDWALLSLRLRGEGAGGRKTRQGKKNSVTLLLQCT